MPHWTRLVRSVDFGIAGRRRARFTRFQTATPRYLSVVGPSCSPVNSGILTKCLAPIIVSAGELGNHGLYGCCRTVYRTTASLPPQADRTNWRTFVAREDRWSFDVAAASAVGFYTRSGSPTRQNRARLSRRRVTSPRVTAVLGCTTGTYIYLQSNLSAGNRRELEGRASPSPT